MKRHFLIFLAMILSMATHASDVLYAEVSGTTMTLKCGNSVPAGAMKYDGSNYWNGFRETITSVIIEKSCASYTGTKLSWLFGKCINLQSIKGLSNLNTANVTNMAHMFFECFSLKTLDLSKFSTANVTWMDGMFADCVSLTTLDLSMFNTSNLTSINDIFKGCCNLTTLNMSGWNTANVTDMSGLFCGCNKLASLDLRGWDTKNVKKMGGMFCGCYSLTTLDLSSFNTTNVTDMSGMFDGCSGLTTLDLSTFDTSNVKDMSNMFDGCDNLTTLDLSAFNTANVTKMKRMFCGCSALTTLNISGWNTAKVTDMSFLFSKCNKLTSLDLREWDTTNVKTMVGMFEDCSGLTTLDLSSFNTANVTDMYFMFGFCRNLTTLDLSMFDTTNVKDMSDMFEGCDNLTTLDLSAFNTANVTKMRSMFDGCLALTTIYASKWDTNKVTDNGAEMFGRCSKLVGGAGTEWNSDFTGLDYARIDCGTDSPGYFTDKNATNVESDYIPFVEMGKQWHVVRSDCDTSTPLVKFENYMLNEKVVKDGKTYLKLNLREDNKTEVYDTGLLREEDCKIYYYRPNTQKEVLMFDYSLQPGDTYESNNVTYKVLSVGDYLEGPEVVSYEYDEKADSVVTHRRYLRKWTVGRTDNELFQKTWIEGVGSLEGPLAYLNDIVLPGMCQDNLAYVEIVNDSEGHYLYLPFSFYDTLNLLVHGCNLPTGEADWSEDCHHQLTYELEGDRLHVYGKVYSNCGRNNYAYFFEKPTDDPLVHRIEFAVQAAEPAATCMTRHTTNFYVPGFDPNVNYIVVDNNGEEHPVINKTPQNEYRPFVEDGKVWAIKVTSPGKAEEWMDFYYLEGDTIVNGQKAKRMLYDKIGSGQEISGKYAGACYEQDKKVYYSSYNGGIQFDFEQLYDFTLSTNDSILAPDGTMMVVNKLSGGIPGFKGTYYDLYYNPAGGKERWLEGVGSDSWPWCNHPRWHNGNIGLLLTCSVGDEVIYYNSEADDPFVMNARKRFDFTHTTKEKPKAPIQQEKGDACISSSEREVARPKVKVPMRRNAEQSLYGEYNDKLLGINLDPLDEAYLVRIVSETGKAVYEKAIDAGSIVALNIDISAYPQGRYTVTVENSRETFTGEFDAQTTGIRDALRLNNNEGIKNNIYNLQGQRLTTLQRGLNIVNGKKVYVK